METPTKKDFKIKGYRILLIKTIDAGIVEVVYKKIKTKKHINKVCTFYLGTNKSPECDKYDECEDGCRLYK